MSAPARAPRTRRGLVLAASLAAHALVLILIGLERGALRVAAPPPTRAIELILTRGRETTAALGQDRAPPAAAPQAPARRPPRAPETAATAPAPVPAPSAEGAPGRGTASAGAAPGAGPGPVEGVRGALRAGLGCAAGPSTTLTPEEKERCLERYGQNARKGPAFIDPIPEEKRAYYDAVQAAYQAARDPAHPFIKGPDGEVRPWGHFPGVGCGMKFGGPPQKPNHNSLTDNIKAEGGVFMNVGPLRCGLALPQGVLTPELGIPTP